MQVSKSSAAGGSHRLYMVRLTAEHRNEQGIGASVSGIKVFASSSPTDKSSKYPIFSSVGKGRVAKTAFEN